MISNEFICFNYHPLETMPESMSRYAENVRLFGGRVNKIIGISVETQMSKATLLAHALHLVNWNLIVSMMKLDIKHQNF
jgi:hypothetical protein